MGSVFHERVTSFNEPDICGTTSVFAVLLSCLVLRLKTFSAIQEPDICGTTSVFSLLLSCLVLRLTRMSSSLSMIVDAEHGPLSERLLKEDAPLVVDASSMGKEHGPLSERMLKEDASSVGEEDF